MKNHMIEKLENPARINELNPTTTLQKLGIQDGDSVCDIGTGTGIFAIAAAKLTHGVVYAVDINAELLKYVAEKAHHAGLFNIQTFLTDRFEYAIDAGCFDFVLLGCVLHEIENKTALLTEIERILKPDGKLCIIEFKKETTTMGPPPSLRLGVADVCAICVDFGFIETECFDLGENMYCLKLETKNT